MVLVILFFIVSNGEELYILGYIDFPHIFLST